MAFLSPARERVRERGIDPPERKNDGRRKRF
jgi:hypothetical protein